jgi:hypothetical protein
VKKGNQIPYLSKALPIRLGFVLHSTLSTGTFAVTVTSVSIRFLFNAHFLFSFFLHLGYVAAQAVFFILFFVGSMISAYNVRHLAFAEANNNKKQEEQLLH